MIQIQTAVDKLPSQGRNCLDKAALFCQEKHADSPRDRNAQPPGIAPSSQFVHKNKPCPQFLCQRENFRFTVI